MFGNILGDLEGKQQEIQKQLDEIQLVSSAAEGSVKIVMTGAKRLVSIDINESLMNPEKKEELEDYIIMAFQDVLAKSSVEEQKLSQNLIQDIMPGLGGLKDLLG